MTKRQRSRLAGRDLAVWSAAYAAEFARDFQDTRQQHGFDRAAETTTAEAALLIADLAVEQMRQWERDNE